MHTAPPPWKGGVLLLNYTRKTLRGDESGLSARSPLGVLQTLADQQGCRASRPHGTAAMLRGSRRLRCPHRVVADASPPMWRPVGDCRRRRPEAGRVATPAPAGGPGESVRQDSPEFVGRRVGKRDGSTGVRETDASGGRLTRTGVPEIGVPGSRCGPPGASCRQATRQEISSPLRTPRRPSSGCVRAAAPPSCATAPRRVPPPGPGSERCISASWPL